MDCFLDENDVVENFPAFDESTLIFWNYPWLNSFQSGGYNLGDNLVPCVTQRDQPESIEGVGTFFFWDQSKEGGIGAATQFVDLLRIPDHF